jgi:hypothetical protein
MAISELTIRRQIPAQLTREQLCYREHSRSTFRTVLFGAEFSYASLQRKSDFPWIGRRIQLSLTFFLNRYPVE